MNPFHTSLPGMVSAVQAANSGSFTAAAKVLGLTPAAVSKSVAGLEARLQLRLFNRTTRQLSLTEEGKQFVHTAREGLAALERAASQASQKQAPQGSVRMSCSVGFGRRYVLPLLPQFLALYPQVQIELALNDQAVDLVKDGFDLGLRGGREPPEGMVARTVCRVPALLVASPQYLAQHGTPRRYTDLAAHQTLRVKYLSGRIAPWLFKDQGRVVAWDGPARLMVSDPEVMLDAVLLHLGIARIGRHHAFEALQRGAVVSLLPQALAGSDITMSLFYPHRAGLAPRVRAWVDFLVEQLAQVQCLHDRSPLAALAMNR